MQFFSKAQAIFVEAIFKIPGGIPHLRHHRDDGLNIDGAGEPAKTVNGLFIRGISLKTNLVQKLQWSIR